MAIVDYAMPLIKIEKLARDVHNLCLQKKYLEALELATNISVEVRILQATLALMDLPRRNNADA